MESDKKSSNVVSLTDHLNAASMIINNLLKDISGEPEERQKYINIAIEFYEILMVTLINYRKTNEISEKMRDMLAEEYEKNREEDLNDPNISDMLN